eukprot:jgi/Astpho2/369/Aster-02244
MSVIGLPLQGRHCMMPGLFRPAFQAAGLPESAMQAAMACCSAGSLGCITDPAQRRVKVVEAMQWSWKGYKAYAWGEDELQPLSRSSHKWFGLGLTLVDSLDTLWMMGLKDEFQEAKQWVAKSLQLDQDTTVNLFETTIRILGGLLAAFHMDDHSPLWLDRALELGLRMTPALTQSPSGIPFSDVNLKSLEVKSPDWGAESSLSEVTSLSLEYTTLGNAAGVQELGLLTRDVVAVVAHTEGCQQGLCPVWVNPHSGLFHGFDKTLGARGDSYYEYLLKYWILTGKTDEAILRQYVGAMQGVRDLLLQRSGPGSEGLLYVGELKGRHVHHKMDHLVCFLPGLLALGHLHGVNTASDPTAQPSDLDLAEDLMQTCYEIRMPTGLAPEIVHFTPHGTGQQEKDSIGGPDFMVKPQDSHNLLRPETVESLFVIGQVTGDVKYQEWGWHIFRAWEMFSRVSTGGYTNLDSVLQIPPPQRDKMESFWTGEALKYLYLMLVDTADEPQFSLKEWVFNTEAHPLPIVGSAPEVRAQQHYLSSVKMTHELGNFRDRDSLAEWLRTHKREQ